MTLQVDVITAVAHVDRARAEAIADSARAYDAPFALITDPAVMADIASMHRGGHATKVELP